MSDSLPEQLPDADTASRQALAAFVAASVAGRVGQAADLLRADPGAAGRSLPAAAVLGDADAVREALTADPAAAVAMDDERGWPPLLYACCSRWHQIDPRRASGLADVVRILLDAGASPETNDGGRPVYRSALKGAVEVDNPTVVQVLLDAGANPDPGQPIAEAAAHRDHRCLQLLLAAGARVAGTWAIGAAVFNDNAGAVSLLVDALEASGSRAKEAATEALADAAADASPPVVVALLEAGADPQATDGDGVSALRRAIRAGRDESAARLRSWGAAEGCTDVDRFIGACLNGERHTAEGLLADHPGLPDRMTDDDRAAIVDAAASRSAQTVAVMLDLGFPTDARRFGEQPLHAAAYQGNEVVVRLLLEAGADVDARDTRFEATPLAFATVGSGERVGKPGDWVGTVRLLIEAGAARDGVWISEKPPSGEVMELLQLHGIGPDEPSEHQEDDEPAVAGTIGTGVLADIARHLEAAYRDLDLELLSSLLHPQVQWTGLCKNSGQVLDWYRTLLAQGTVPTVESIEVDGDAVVVGLTVSLRAEGARAAPPQRLYQVFTVDGTQIVDIRAYPDRASVLARADKE